MNAFTLGPYFCKSVSANRCILPPPPSLCFLAHFPEARNISRYLLLLSTRSGSHSRYPKKKKIKKDKKGVGEGGGGGCLIADGRNRAVERNNEPRGKAFRGPIVILTKYWEANFLTAPPSLIYKSPS